MKKPYKSFTKPVVHKGEQLEITINVYREPVIKTEDKLFYTHIEIKKDDKMWGQLYLQEPAQEHNFPQAIKDLTRDLDLYKDEPNEK